MGTHPLAPSTLDDGSPLESVAGELPYLLKLMAAAQPLSLQTHPDRITAEAGFEREEELGIPRDSPQRIYRDPFAKPEMLCALTTFDTLCGFRPVDNTISLLREIDARDLAEFLQHEKLATTVAALYRGEFDPQVDDCRVPAIRPCRSHARQRTRRSVSGRPLGRGDVAAEPGAAVGRRGRVPGPREPARLSPRFRRRGDGQQRQRRARRHDGEAHRRRRAAEGARLRTVARPGRETYRARTRPLALRHAEHAVRHVGVAARRRRHTVAQATGRELVLWVSGAHTASASTWPTARASSCAAPPRSSSSKRA